MFCTAAFNTSDMIRIQTGAGWMPLQATGTVCTSGDDAQTLDCWRKLSDIFKM